MILEELYQKQPDIDVKSNLIKALFAYGGYLNDDYVLEFEKSINYFKRILDLDPDNHRAHYNLGIAYFNLNKFEEALFSYKNAISIKPDYKHGHYNIGLLHETTGNFPEAIKSYEKALDIDPKYVYAMHAIKAIKMEMGDSIESKKKELEADDSIEKIIALLEMSSRVRLDMLQEILNVSKDAFLDIVISWGEKKYCELDGDFLIICKESLDRFLEDLKQNGLDI